MLIGKLADATGVTTKTLRFYEAQRLLAPPNRTAGGYRDYPDSASGRVLFIRRAQAAGLTLNQIREILDIRDTGQAPCHHVADLVKQRIDEVTARLAELEHTRTELFAVRERLTNLDPADCDDDICAAIAITPNGE